MKKPHILDYNLQQWQEYISKKNYDSFRAKQIFNWLHKQLVVSISEINNIPQSLKEDLQQNFTWHLAEASQEVNCPEDGTARYLLNSGDHQIETVWLPYENRTSACISVQEGCSFHCSFCATGRMNFGGNLSSGEILSQVYSLIRLRKQKISNVVFMGMGEPFMNYENSLKAADFLNDPQGLELSKRHITFSTVGYLPGIRRFFQEQQPYNLALSVHSLNYLQRKKIMPIEEKYPIAQVFDFIAEHRKILRKNQLTFEYILIQDFNMQREDALALAKQAKRLNAKINLIPINTSYKGLVAPNEKQINEFWKILNKEKVVAVNRRSPGKNIEAACGMLAGNSLKYK